MDRTLCEIAGAIRTLLVIDNAKQNYVFRHYARVLMDMDLSQQIFHEIMFEREIFSFNIEVSCEWHEEFCSYCKNIDLSVVNNRRLHPIQNKNVEESHNCLQLGIYSVCSHIYREGNCCAVKLVTHGHSIPEVS